MTNYHHIDHSHCWTSKNPPCGQKIKHFECCVCQKPHPDITEAMEEGYRRGVKETVGKVLKEARDIFPNITPDINNPN